MYFGRSHGCSMAGNYYFAIGVGAGNLGRDLKGVPIPVRFSIGVDGQPKGAPAYAQEGIAPAATPGITEPASPVASETPSSTSPSPVATSSEAEDGPNLLVRVAPVLLGLLALGAGAWAVVRRRRPGRTDTPDERG